MNPLSTVFDRAIPAVNQVNGVVKQVISIDDGVIVELDTRAGILHFQIPATSRYPVPDPGQNLSVSVSVTALLVGFDQYDYRIKAS